MEAHHQTEGNSICLAIDPCRLGLGAAQKRQVEGGFLSPLFEPEVVFILV